MRYRPVALLFALAAGAAIQVLAQSPPEAAIEQGRKILEANCARCHAIGLLGESPLAIAPPFRTLHRRYPVENLAEALSEGIVTGHKEMPAFVFGDEEIGAIIAYLKALEVRR
ncbi:MAG: cytochrome c [Hyphomicrobiaceae bacterium]|nr:MAG: cytochrome c [Hyphomicrobiaceae bacterium]